MLIKKENVHTWVKVLFSDLKDEDIIAVVPKGYHPDNISVKNKLVGQVTKRTGYSTIIQDGSNGDYISFILNEDNALLSVFDFWKTTTKEKTIIELEHDERLVQEGSGMVVNQSDQCIRIEKFTVTKYL